MSLHITMGRCRSRNRSRELAREDAAEARNEVTAITKELAAQLDSELVVARCCKALQNDKLSLAAASPDVLLLVLNALRRHASCAAVTEEAWCALSWLPIYRANEEAAVEHGLLELALAVVYDTTASVEAVTASLAVFVQLCFFQITWHALRS